MQNYVCCNLSMIFGQTTGGRWNDRLCNRPTHKPT